MTTREYKRGEQGFSMVEVLIALVILTIVSGAVFALLRDSMKTSHATMELTDAQESARTAQEYITRDLVNTGDGLNSINNINVPVAFVTNYLTQNPVTDAAPLGLVNLGLITADNDVPANTLVLGTPPPAVQVRSTPYLTDRLTIAQMERSEVFIPITISVGDFTPVDGRATISPTDVDSFQVGEIYFITSANGGIFATITAIEDGTTPTPKLVFGFGAGDVYGLNSQAQFDAITDGATLPISICRMKLIHYYINSDGLLMRRVFGVRGAGFNESVIAEHVVSLQFRYFLNMKDAAGNVVQPLAQLTTSQEQVETRQIEVTITVETPHSLQNGQPQQISMTTSTSVRNMQFRQSLQPTAGG